MTDEPTSSGTGTGTEPGGDADSAAEQDAQSPPGDRTRRGAFGPVGYAVTFGILAVVVAVLVGGGVWLVRRMGSEPALPDGIQFVLPPAGGAMMSQDRVGVQTQQSWTCTLTIDGIRVPESQYVGVKELGECYFQAGPERIIEQFGPGLHRVQATVFPLANPEATQSYSWSFQTQ